MNFKSYILNFRGYWLFGDVEGIPNKPGIYCVYNCINMPENNTVYINRLLYIGESENVQKRIEDHEKKQIWEMQCAKGEELCFSYGSVCYEVSTEDRRRIEEALIFKHMPPCNQEYVNSTPQNETQVQTKGENFLLHGIFISSPK